MIDSGHESLSIARQCELVGVSRSWFYYQPSGETELNLALMRLIDEQHLRTPYYGPVRWLGICAVRATSSGASGSGG
jgi:putative transposase